MARSLLKRENFNKIWLYSDYGINIEIQNFGIFFYQALTFFYLLFVKIWISTHWDLVTTVQVPWRQFLITFSPQNYRSRHLSEIKLLFLINTGLMDFHLFHQCYNLINLRAVSNNNLIPIEIAEIVSFAKNKDPISYLYCFYWVFYFSETILLLPQAKGCI